MQYSSFSLWVSKGSTNFVQFPGSIERTDDIVSSLDDGAWNMAYVLDIIQNLGFKVQESAVDKEMSESEKNMALQQLILLIITRISIW